MRSKVHFLHDKKNFRCEYFFKLCQAVIFLLTRWLKAPPSIAHAALIQQLLSPKYRESHREREMRNPNKWKSLREPCSSIFSLINRNRKVVLVRTQKKSKRVEIRLTTQLERIFIESQYILIVVFIKLIRKCTQSETVLQGKVSCLVSIKKIIDLKFFFRTFLFCDSSW